VSAVSVVLIDDHPLFSRGLELLLNSTAEIRVVGRATDATAAVPLVEQAAPDVAIVDLGMPPPGGLEAVRSIKARFPRVRVLVLSGTVDQAEAEQALRVGAEGFLPKTAEPSELVPPLLAMAGGWSVLPVALLRRLTEGVAGKESPPAGLSEDETTIWRLLADGLGVDEIAIRMFVSERTVKRMTASLLRRLGVDNRAQAAALAGRCGLLD
jgi:two-component system, NarL family, nitrate/nitrite response regulator NarL